jgi:hypothetical protein
MNDSARRAQLKSVRSFSNSGVPASSSASTVLTLLLLAETLLLLAERGVGQCVAVDEA